MILLLALVASAAEVKQGVAGKNIQSCRFQSESLGEQRYFNVAFPADYETSTRRYPTLYLLHGLGDDHTAWSLMTNLSGYAAQHGILIVMPDGGRSFYVNSAADAKAKFEDLVIKDLIPYVDSHFRTIPLPRARAVAGLSMGGYGAAFLGLKHYRRFAVLGSFSGAVGIARTAGDEAARRTKDLQGLFGAGAERVERDPFALLEKVPPANMPAIYIACGGQDFLLQQNRDFVQLLAEKKIPYEYREFSPRAHTWDFWDDQIRVFLEMLDGWFGR